MPGQRLPMRQVREVLRLKHVCGQSGHRIAAAVGISRYTVAEYLRRATVVGITWPVPPELDDAALERKLFTPPFVAEPTRPQPEWTRIHAELRRPGVTLLLLWEEYRAGQPDGYGYSRFCDLYAEWRGRLSPTMRQAHPAGERLFVDYAGQTVAVIDAATGATRAAQIFVAALGASNLVYAEARWSQGLADWIGCHVNTFAAFGGVTRQIVCDNLKAGVTAACRYEPGINRSYAEMAAHYGTAVVPARVRRPRDKAKVEVAVQVVQRWILARLRHRRFFSLADLNGAIRDLVTDLNARPMRHLGISRQALFERLERAVLLPLPAEPYAYAEWHRCRAGLDYHIELHGHFYSVPYRLARTVIEARVTEATVELFHGGTRVASHARSPQCPGQTTTPGHMPSAHRRHAEWTPTRLLQEAAAIGPATAELIKALLADKPHPEQGFRAGLGILRLVRGYGPTRVEAACRRGLDIGARSYGSVQSILRNNLDRLPTQSASEEKPQLHSNIRGSRYYH
ncbi:transposase [Rhodovastum atsumiense]|uniref:IS21 family transposase n=1 Tax=Rhodovastum atsumiense TaxID=504468 RepID=A0A5M6IIG3_9PROT|nr:IS21 family transposase [Rhodovastum atsumiense]KAA5608050.1 IS21 family transposase [Rhodovastum atsumiense]CAH2603457.1 transposase [Rhodovastum atsumiense]